MVPCVMTKCGNARWIGPAQSKSVQASLSPPPRSCSRDRPCAGTSCTSTVGWMGSLDGFVARGASQSSHYRPFRTSKTLGYLGRCGIAGYEGTVSDHQRRALDQKQDARVSSFFFAAGHIGQCLGGRSYAS